MNLLHSFPNLKSLDIARNPLFLYHPSPDPPYTHRLGLSPGEKHKDRVKIREGMGVGVGLERVVLGACGIKDWEDVVSSVGRLAK